MKDYEWIMNVIKRLSQIENEFIEKTNSGLSGSDRAYCRTRIGNVIEFLNKIYDI